MTLLPEPTPEPDWAAFAQALIGSRSSVPPKRLVAPGPDAEQLRALVAAAATAPDHRGLKPWRLLRVAEHQRNALADLFEAVTRERGATAGDDIAKSRAKALRGPVLLLAVLRHEPADDEVPAVERAVSLGAALMNLLLAAHAMGYAGMLTSGRSVRSARLAQAFGLAPHEQAVCFVNLGTPLAARRGARPQVDELLADWAGPPGQNVPG